MLPRRMRLRVQDSLRRKPLRRVTGNGLLINVFSSMSQESRFGVVLTRRLAPRAVDRNRLKRKIFDALRLVGQHTPRYDFLIIPHSRAVTMTKEEISQTLLSLFARLP